VDGVVLELKVWP